MLPGTALLFGFGERFIEMPAKQEMKYYERALLALQDGPPDCVPACEKKTFSLSRQIYLNFT